MSLEGGEGGAGAEEEKAKEGEWRTRALVPFQVSIPASPRQSVTVSSGAGKRDKEPSERLTREGERTGGKEEVRERTGEKARDGGSGNFHHQTLPPPPHSLISN